MKRTILYLAVLATVLTSAAMAAQQLINIGSTSNDGTGDGLRSAFGKVNTNDTELYTALASSAGLRAMIGDETGSGALVFGTSPILITPTLGVATATSVNGLTITTTTGTVTIANGKTATISNTLTLTGSDGSTVAFGAGGTVAYVANKLNAFAATTSSELAGVISDETGSGALVFGTSPALVTPTLGVATATSINGLTITTTTGTVTIANGKTATISNTLTFAGTDGSTLNVGMGGTLGTAAFTAATAYEVPLTFARGVKRTGNVVTTTTGDIHASNPTVWWDARDLALADGADVTSWPDRIGGNVLTTGENFPKYASGGMNSRPWVFFDRTAPSDPLVCSAGIFSGSYTGFSIASVLRITSSLGTYGSPIVCVGTSSPPNANGAYGNHALALVVNPNVTSVPGFTWFLTNNYDLYVSQVSGKHRVPFFREMVTVLVYDGSNYRLWIDGVCISSDAAGSGSISIDGGAAMGVLYMDDTNHMSVGCSALAVWTRALTTAEVRAVSSEFADRYTQSEQRSVILMGDSTYEGTAAPAGGTLMDVLQSEVLSARIENAARGGKTMATQASGASPYAEMYGSIRRGQIVVLGPGSIDISNIDSVGTVQANHAAVVASLHAQGAIVICPTMIDIVSASQATSDANRATYNAWILAGSSGADYVVDLTGIAELSNDDAHSNATYFQGDGGHLTADGIALQAAPIVTAIRNAIAQ